MGFSRERERPPPPLSYLSAGLGSRGAADPRLRLRLVSKTWLLGELGMGFFYSAPPGFCDVEGLLRFARAFLLLVGRLVQLARRLDI